MAHIQLFRAYYEPKGDKKANIQHINEVLQDLSDSINNHIRGKEVINVDLTTSHLGNGHTEYVVSVLTKD
ncbi:hypothetical protein [uncultured Brachyspira sp.]|uniref:hypothetical protein n=1 Tax=uncultured Brachyspira sp. TaxID=221953 RepID=UPI0025CB8CA9|nr:hypothetical protein [uncultured Brachyspira sp.]